MATIKKKTTTKKKKTTKKKTTKKRSKKKTVRKTNKSLVIVESPAKAKTINKYLGTDYILKASMGHIRDLPKYRLGVDPDNDFLPKYNIIRDRKELVKDLKYDAERCKRIYLAPDPDREGEAIAWHLAEILTEDKDKIYRVSFNEITKQAVLDAFDHAGKININKVESQQTRRILDRILGYKVSPLLWKKVASGLSAGRVQTVALRLICEREDLIEKFNPEEYWKIAADLFKNMAPKTPFVTFLDKIDGEKAEIKIKEESDTILAALKGATYTVKKVDKKEKKRHPYAPFITSTLQQAGVNRLKWSAQKTMMVAQQLYEGIEIGEEGSTGLITYMRTDSFNISQQALNELRKYITGKYPAAYLPEKPNFYKSKKGAQEAHECVRPSSVFRDPEAMSKFLNKDQLTLYKLIWERFVACQMADAQLLTTAAEIEAADKYIFRATGTEVLFDGFMLISGTELTAAKKKKKKDDDDDDDDEEKDETRILPPLEAGESLNLKEIRPTQHFTKPPARYSEATLIKILEELGIGRPSTYAPTIATITKRIYVQKEKGRLVPSELGRVVVILLVKHFPDLFDVKFTSKMEQELDDIEEGKGTRLETLKEFYAPLMRDLEKAEVEMQAIKQGPIPTDQKCDKCDSPMVIKSGRRGQFLACSAFPKCYNAKSLPTGFSCPKCKKDLSKRKSKRGRPFFGCTGYPDCDFIANTEEEAREKGATGEFKDWQGIPPLKALDPNSKLPPTQVD